MHNFYVVFIGLNNPSENVSLCVAYAIRLRAFKKDEKFLVIVISCLCNYPLVVPH